MTRRESLKIFEDKNIRVVWDDVLQEWQFSVVDVVEVLTDSVNPSDYLKKMRKRDHELDSYMGTNCPLVLKKTPKAMDKTPMWHVGVEKSPRQPETSLSRNLGTLSSLRLTPTTTSIN